jgi:hypothetical protein
MKAPKPKAFDPIPKGTHVARLYSIVHLGTTTFQYKGEDKSSNKIRLTFELCNEKKEFKEGEGEKPYSISREFGWSMSPRGKLRPFIEGMTGAAMYDEEAYNLEIENLLGEACLITVVHEEKNGNVYANILSASALPKGMEAPEMVNEGKFISVDTSPESEIEALPEFLQKKIHESEEWTARMRNKADMATYGASTGYQNPVHRPNSEATSETDEEIDESSIPF